MDAEGLGDLTPDRVDGVESRHRLLKHHADLTAAQLLHGALGPGEQILAVKRDDAARNCAGRLKPHDAEQRHRLARS